MRALTIVSSLAVSPCVSQATIDEHPVVAILEVIRIRSRSRRHQGMESSRDARAVVASTVPTQIEDIILIIYQTANLHRIGSSSECVLSRFTSRSESNGVHIRLTVLNGPGEFSRILVNIKYRKTFRLEAARELIYYDIIEVESTRRVRSVSRLQLHSDVLTFACIVIEANLERLIACGSRLDNLNSYEGRDILRIGHNTDYDRVAAIITTIFTRVELQTQTADTLYLRQDSILILRIVVGRRAIV